MSRRRATLAAAAALGLAALAAGPAAGAPSVLVKLPPGADAADVARDAGLTLARTFPQIGWAEVVAPEGDAGEARDRLRDDPRVFRLDYQRAGESLRAGVVPNDPFAARPPLFSSDGVSTDWHWQQARFYPAWDLGRAGAGTRIAVIDSEIDTAHPDLAGKVAAAYNAERQYPETHATAAVRASDAQIAEARASADGGDLHGTHVAGLAAAATDNGVGVAGAGHDAALMPVKVTLTVAAGPAGDATYVANAVEGIVWAADNGADVMNMSFGTATYHQALADAVAYAAARDVLPVAAAGNTQNDGPAPGAALYPGALPEVLAVGAIGPGGAIAGYSTHGDYVDVAAPGSRILSTWDTRVDGVLLGGRPLDGYEILSGTSMAAPIAAGLAALVRDLRPDLSAAQARAVIESTAADRGAPGRDPVYGAGVIDAEAALRAAAQGAVPAAPIGRAGSLATGAFARAPARLAYACRVGGRAVRADDARRPAAAPGARLVCRGRTAPRVARARLRVQRVVDGRWRTIGAARTTADGRFGFAVRLAALGRWRVRARLVRTAAHRAANGAAVTVAVTRRA